MKFEDKKFRIFKEHKVEVKFGEYDNKEEKSRKKVQCLNI